MASGAGDGMSAQRTLATITAGLSDATIKSVYEHLVACAKAEERAVLTVGQLNMHSSAPSTQALVTAMSGLSLVTLASVHDHLMAVASPAERAAVHSALAPYCADGGVLLTANPLRSQAAAGSVTHQLLKLVIPFLTVEDGHFARLASRGFRDAVDELRHPDRPKASALKAITSLARAQYLVNHTGMGRIWAGRMCNVGAILGNVEVVRWARENGHSWDAATCKVAASGGHLAILAYCLEDGCPHDVDDLALDVIRKGHTACLNFLVDKGAHTGKALMAASGFGNVECARLLLDRGADVNFTSPNGSTALLQACMGRHRG